MNPELLHPKVIHVPIALAVLMPLIAGGLWLAWIRGWLPRRTWLVAVALQGVLVAGAVVALQSGEIDEEQVESVVPEAALEAHEETAEIFVWVAVCVLLMMIAGGAVPRENAARIIAGVAAAATVGVLGLGYSTGQKGGALVYEHGAASAFMGNSSGPDRTEHSHGAEDDDDDD